MAEMPDNLVVGGPATSRPVVLSPPSDQVIRPRLAWRLLLAFFAFPIPVSLVSGSFQWGSLFIMVPLLWYATSAWRRKVVLRGDELREQGTFTRYPVLRAADIAAFTARQENSGDIGDETNYVVLRLWQADSPPWTQRAYMRAWWGDWNVLVRWVAFHHTKPGPDGIPRWTISTDEATMRRVARLLEASSPPPYA